jgi:lipoyl(octanoyl) transferase
VGYPIFDLRALRAVSGGRMGPVDFVRGMEEALIQLCGGFGVRAGRICGLTGVWCGGSKVNSGQWSVVSSIPGEQPSGAKAHTDIIGSDLTCQTPSEDRERKIAAIGIHVARGITSHGFAFNVTTDLRDFELIIPCGIADHAVTSLKQEVQNPDELPGLEAIAQLAAQHFGQVFGEPVQAVESLAALRGLAEKTQPQSPAEDMPLRIPSEVERLRGGAERPIRA